MKGCYFFFLLMRTSICVHIEVLQVLWYDQHDTTVNTHFVNKIAFNIAIYVSMTKIILLEVSPGLLGSVRCLSDLSRRIMLFLSISTYMPFAKRISAMNDLCEDTGDVCLWH